MSNEPPAHFSNARMDPAAIPDYRQVELSPVAASYLPYAVLGQLLFWLPFLALAAALRLVEVIPLAPEWWMIGLLGLAGAWFTIIAWLDAQRRAWALREHDLIYRYGIIWRKVVIVPFARIQHVETSNGPMERAFGLMRVKCFTAGGMTADLSVVGLDTDNAEKVRSYLLEQIRSDTGQGMARAERDEAASGHEVMGPHDER